MATNTLRPSPPLKWHGGKHYLAKQIIALMPPRCKTPNAPAAADPGFVHYVEPFCGGCSVLLQMDPEGISEVINDLDGRVSNFWRVLQDDDLFARFSRRLDAVPFSEWEWTEAGREHGEDAVEGSVRFFIYCRQSLAGRMGGFAPLSRNRTRRNMNEQASAWLNAVEGLRAVHDRLRRVVVLNREATEVIRQQDGLKTLFYLDPPYLSQTRSADQVYAREMSDRQHGDLLATVRRCTGKVMLSGYPSDLYDRELRDWQRHEFELPNQAAGGKQKRRMTEVVWCNFR